MKPLTFVFFCCFFLNVSGSDQKCGWIKVEMIDSVIGIECYDKNTAINAKEAKGQKRSKTQ